jgi:RNA polymerase sigma-B factor
LIIMTTTYASPPGPGPVVDASTTEELLRRYADLKADHLDPADLRHRIIEKNLPMANRLARHYVGRGERLEDLGQVAALALINAVDRFDPGRQIPFDAYAIPTIVGALKRHFRDAAWGMRVPRSTQELARTASVAVRTLTQRQGRAPTTVELADHLRVGVDELRTAIGAWQAYHPVSLNVRNPSGVGELLDLIGAVDPRFAGVDDHQCLRVALAELTARERRILALRFYREMTQTEIAAEVGVSQMQVSRLLVRTLTRLRAALVPPGVTVARPPRPRA